MTAKFPFWKLRLDCCSPFLRCITYTPSGRHVMQNTAVQFDHDWHTGIYKTWNDLYSQKHKQADTHEVLVRVKEEHFVVNKQRNDSSLSFWKTKVLLWLAQRCRTSFLRVIGRFIYCFPELFCVSNLFPSQFHLAGFLCCFGRCGIVTFFKLSNMC